MDGGRGQLPDVLRRRLLRQLAAGTLMASAAPAVSTSLLRAAKRSGPGAAPAAPVRAGKVGELAELFRVTDRDTLFAVAAEQVRGGASHRELLAATLLAGVRDVRPWPPGVKFHVVLMVPSALALAEAGDGIDLWAPVFHNLHVLKWSQQWDVEEGDWTLPPRPAPLGGDAAAIRRALTAALEEWDVATADRAVVAAARSLTEDDLFEILWPMGARDFQNIGHKMIHVSQIHRVGALLDDEQRVEALRSLVYGLLGGGPGETTAAFARNRDRVDGLRSPSDEGRRPEVSGDLLVLLRTASDDEAERRVAQLLADGVPAGAIWDGLRLAASEMLFRLARSEERNAQLLAVHPLTILNAFYFAYRRTAVESTRRLLLLQATAWMPAARDLLQAAKGLSLEEPGFDALDAPSETISVKRALTEADRDHVSSGSLVLRMAQDPAAAAKYADRCRVLVARKAPEHHHHKYAAALFEELGRTDPAWSPYLLATCLSYVPGPGDDDSEVFRETRLALKDLA
jgi:hypothetical protein